MKRGEYRKIIDKEEYRSSKKDLFIELQRIDFYWYDLIAKNVDIAGKDSKTSVIKQVKEFKRIVESNLNKRFIYFICSRIKVRFCTKNKPKLSKDKKKLIVVLRIGKDKKERVIALETSVLNALFSKGLHKDRVAVGAALIQDLVKRAEIGYEGRYITLENQIDDKFSISVHDFLNHLDINLGIETKVQYVGYTQNPNSRPLNGSHAGLNEILYKISNEEYDILIAFNVFKVTTYAQEPAVRRYLMIANAFTDEIPLDEEGFLIEKCLITYFDSKNQNRNKVKEKSELENILIKLEEFNKIQSVCFKYEVDSLSEYYKFSSTQVTAKHNHLFTCSVDNYQLNLSRDKDGFKVCLDSTL